MRYSEHYSQVCGETEAHAARILGRELTAREKRAIWGAGTLTWLEMRVQVPMRYAQVAEQVEVVLEDAADDHEARLAELVAGLVGMLAALLERDLSAGERDQLARIPTAISAIQMGEEIAAAAHPQRETLLQQMLATL